MRRVGILMVGLVMLIFTGIALSSCEKWVTPKRVERILKRDSWKATEFMYMDTNITAVFASVTIGFGDENSMTFLNSGGVKGEWSVSSGKKPTIVYITNILDDPYTKFADNWEVNTCSKNKVTMSADHGSFTNSLTLERVIP